MDLALYRDLESFQAWSMGRLFSVALQSPRSNFDDPHSMGMGTFRATLQHIAAAERIWLDRWKGKPTSGMPEMPSELGALARTVAEIALERKLFLESHPVGFEHSVSYLNLFGEPLEFPLGELVAHVFNHGVHHRAQAVHFLKRQGIAIAGGLDYIFFRIAVPTCPLDPEPASNCRNWGLQVGDGSVPYAAPNKHSLTRYSEYNHWAMEVILEQALGLDDAELNRDFAIGHGTIRKTIQHMYDAECFWQTCAKSPGSLFPPTPLTTSISEFVDLWGKMADEKRAWIERTEPGKLGDTIQVNFGAGPMRFRFSEGILQLSVHGTLHRAQVSNMLRMCGLTPKSLDYVTWLRAG
ncbi:MAG: DinB family protein [Pirellula sp.]